VLRMAVYLANLVVGKAQVLEYGLVNNVVNY